MSYKPRSLFSLIDDINRTLFLPHIQRPFVWDRDQMARLFDSLMRNYPIQTLLFWRTKDAIKARRFMPELEWDADLSDFYDEAISKENVQKVFVLDGQQRLQTLFTLFAGGLDGGHEAYVDLTSGSVADAEGLKYHVDFSRTAPSQAWYRLRDLKEADAQRNAEEIADRENDRLAGALKEGPDERKQREKLVRRNVSQIASLLREERHFWIQELDGVANEFPYKTILDIFVRVNSGGTKLDAADLMFAAMKEQWSDIEQRVEEVAEMLNRTQLGFDKNLVLKCLVVAHGRGAELEPEKFTGPASGKLLEEIETEWPRAEAAFKELVDFIERDLGLFSEKAVRTFNSFVPLFDYLFHNPSPGESARLQMRAFHYKAQLFGWFGAQTDSIINALHTRLGKPLMQFPLDSVKDYFKGKQDVELTRQHALNMRVRHIVLNLVYFDTFGVSPFKVRFKGNEPHIDHIYPQSALRSKLGLGADEVNAMGNYRFIGALDNIRKRAELPSTYFKRLKDGGVDIKRHLLLDDYANDPAKLVFSKEAYLEFLKARGDRIVEIAKRVVNPKPS